MVDSGSSVYVRHVIQEFENHCRERSLTVSCCSAWSFGIRNMDISELLFPVIYADEPSRPFRIPIFLAPANRSLSIILPKVTDS